MMSPPVIDAEVHVLHPEACTRGFAEHRAEPACRAIHRHPDFPSLAGRMDLDYLLHSMDDSGIDQALIMGLAWRDAAVQRDNNEYVAECVKQRPDRFRALYIPDLQRPSESAEEIGDLDEAVFAGIKVISGWQDRHVDDEALTPIWRAARARQMPVMVHTDHMTQSIDGDTPQRFYRFISRHPELRILAPHLGGLLCFYSLLPKVRRILRNVYFVTSVSATMEMVELAARVVPDQLVFGTDFPFNHCHDQSTPLSAVRGLDITPATLASILGGTLTKALELGTRATTA